MSKKSKSSGSVVDLKKYDYKRVSIRGADGKVRHSAINGDAVAKAMLLAVSQGVGIGEIIKANDLSSKFTIKDAVNPGLLRMSVGGSLRALVKAGTPVKIGKVRVESLKQAVELPKVEKAASKPKKTAKAKKAPRKPRAKKQEPIAPQADAA